MTRVWVLDYLAWVFRDGHWFSRARARPAMFGWQEVPLIWTEEQRDSTFPAELEFYCFREVFGVEASAVLVELDNTELSVRKA